MFEVLAILSIIASILLIAVVLLQPGKGDLSASFGGLSSQMGSMFGMQKTANILSKFTMYLAIFILLTAVVTNKFFVGEEQVQGQHPSAIGKNPDEATKAMQPPSAPEGINIETEGTTDSDQPATDAAPANTEAAPAEEPPANE